MARLIQFLLKLAVDGFYGEVRITFLRGHPRQVIADTSYLAETLPQPDATSAAYQKLLAAVVKGVDLPT